VVRAGETLGDVVVAPATVAERVIAELRAS
jgi:hypothetical protein